MAIFFDMWMECEAEDEIEPLRAHFDGFQINLLTGRTVTWNARREFKGISIASPDLGKMGVRTLQDALETTESGLHLYHHLKNGPDFKFARVALEASYIPAEELKDYVEVLLDRPYLQLQCVMNADLYRTIGSPSNCVPFREGYFWNPYRGETYMPLHSNDQQEMNDLYRKLLG